VCSSDLYGPHLENFRWAEEILQAAGVGTAVHDAVSLANAARHLLENTGERRRLGEAARAALHSHRGAARRQANLVASLGEKGPGIANPCIITPPRSPNPS
jgi:3-deoxy-D-manno-octulosonic-acid transferase